MKKHVLSLSIQAMFGGYCSERVTVFDEPMQTHCRPVDYLPPNIRINADPPKGEPVKVRFRGAANSDDILDFSVFLSPNNAPGAVHG